ncbi:MAG: MATE family efflux transporter [Clostridia bacterium]|nr:MATE family efflux transporter [Clostridia bacterium]
MFKKFFGDKSFYKRLFALALPIMIQNGITNFVNMLDNIMIGRVGTVEMNGVAVANQLFFVFNLCIFGAVSGAGIFGAQFFGKGDHKGVRDTFRFKILFCCLLAIGGIVLFLFGGEQLIGLYLKGEGSAADAAASLGFGKDYMQIMLIGLLPYTVVQCYSSTLRETGRPMVPMTAGVAAVLVNLVFNYILIFGKFGAPALGVNGAAIATVISRFAELLIVVFWTRFHAHKNPFIIGAFHSFKVPPKLVGQIFVKGLPLMLNETMWAAGIAMVNQCYSVRGLDVVGAQNISQTFWNVFSIVFMAVGVANGIILGQRLGAKDHKGAKDAAVKLITFSVLVSMAVGVIYALAAEFIPLAYNTTDEVRLLATRLMQISALAMPLDAFAHAAYFTLRSGGKTFITILFDSCFVWAIHVPAAFILSRYTALPILGLFAVIQFSNIIKDVLGYIFVKKGIWIKNIV